MDEKMIPEIQNIVLLLNDNRIRDLYNNEYAKIERIKNRKEFVQNQINELAQKTKSINNYKNNLEYVINYYKQIKLQLNESFIIYDAKTDKIDFEIKKLEDEKSRCQHSLNEYELISSNVLNKLTQINQYIAHFPENKDLFAQDLKNIDIQINFLKLQSSKLKMKMNDFQEQLQSLHVQKSDRIKKRENFQSYLNDMIENPEKSFLSVNVKQLKDDKEQLLTLMTEMEQLNKKNLTIDFDAQKGFAKIYSNYLNGNFNNNEEFGNALKQYQEKINNDKSILKREPEVVEQLNKKIDELQLKLQLPIVEEKKQLSIVEDEIVDIRPARISTINKLKGKTKKIIAFCTSALLVLGMGVSAKLFNNKSKDITNAGQNTLLSWQTIDENTHDPSFNDSNINLRDEYFVPNTIEVKDGSYIYENSYDAINDNNAMSPYFGYNQKRNICGVTIQMPDGNIKTLYKNDKDFYDNYYNLINSGGTVKLYLTGQDNDYEGFYKVDDSISTGMRR